MNLRESSLIIIEKLSSPLPALPVYGETKLSPANGDTCSFLGDECSDPTPGNEESMTRGRDRQESQKSEFDLLAECITYSPADMTLLIY